MGNFCRCVIVGCVVAFASSAAIGDEFFIGFNGVSSLRGNKGAIVSTAVDATLLHDNPDARRETSGWSFSVVADNATIVDITTIDTVSCERTVCSGVGLGQEGFNQTELSPSDRGAGECDGRAGAVSAVILALIEKATLPSDVTHVIARMQVEAEIPVDSGRTVALRYVSGCAGSGLPVPTIISRSDDSIVPTKATHEIDLLTLQCFCDAQVAIAFSESNNGAGAPSWLNTIGSTGTVDPENPCGGDQNCEAAGVLELMGNPGDVVSGRVYANLISQFPAETLGQLSAWSLSIEYQDRDSGSVITSVTTRGTVACAEVDCPNFGLRGDGFDQTSLIVPKENNGMQGAVSAIVLSFIEDVRLPEGMSTVLELTVEATIPGEVITPGPGTSGNQSLVGTLILRDALRGLGQPVDNVASSSGVAFEYENADTVKVAVVATPSPFFFLRGNANGDSKVDIADTIWIVNFLFRNGGSPLCLDAADVNDNEIVELSDALFLIFYFFGGLAEEQGFESLPPLAPFPSCGLDPPLDDPDDDVLDCQGSVLCN